jgi:hypothetical protein
MMHLDGITIIYMTKEGRYKIPLHVTCYFHMRDPILMTVIDSG